MLRNSSKYFRALLQRDSAEQHSGRLVRVDPHHSLTTFKAVLSWAYTLATPAVEASELPALMRAASDYLLPDLRAECLKIAHASISLHNAMDWLLFAAENHEEALKGAALEFASANYSRIQDRLPQQTSEQLLRLYVTFPGVALELMNSLAAVARAALRKRGRDE